MTDTLAAQIEALARVRKAMNNPYHGGIWEGRSFNTDSFVTIRLADAEIIVSCVSKEHSHG